MNMDIDRKKNTKILIPIGIFAIVLIALVFLLVSCSTKSYTVNFETDSETKIVAQTVKSKKKVLKPYDPTKEGYAFLGWYLNEKEYDFMSFVTSDMTLKAKWDTIEYTVIFDSDGGNDVKAQKIYFNSKVVKPVDPEKEGSVFLGWTLGNTEYNFDNSVTRNITLKASWNSTSAVITFDTNGGNEIEKQVIDINGKAEKPLDPTKDGYSFAGWYLEDDLFDFDQEIAKNITLIANWEEAKYTITFDTGGGSAVANQTVGPDGLAKKPSSNPTKAGHTFISWQVDSKDYDFSSKVTKNITIVAKWDAHKYTVTFDSSGGTSVSSQTVSHGSKVTRPGNPSRSQYAFAGWTLNGSSYNFDSAVTGNITLKATWSTAKYTITFNSNGGSAVSSQTIDYNGKATKPSNPTRSGYVFAGWQLNGVDYNFNNTVTGNITLVAKWTAGTYTVTFNSNGGSVVSNQTVAANGKARKPIDPIRSGYYLNRWTLNGSTYDFNTPVTGNITLVAEWKSNQDLIYP